MCCMLCAGCIFYVYMYVVVLPPYQLRICIYMCVSVVLSSHLQTGTTALFIAVGANNYNAVIRLIAKGANVNARRVREPQCPETLHVTLYVIGFAKRDQIPQKSKIELASPRYST